MTFLPILILDQFNKQISIIRNVFFLSKIQNEPNLDDGIVPELKITEGVQIGANNPTENADFGVNSRIANNVNIGFIGFGFEGDLVTNKTLEYPH